MARTLATTQFAGTSAAGVLHPRGISTTGVSTMGISTTGGPTAGGLGLRTGLLASDAFAPWASRFGRSDSDARERQRRRTPKERRAGRILILISLIFALSVADLLFTLTHLSTVGMIELNPIARNIILTGTPLDLVLFKFASVGVGCGCLYLGRKSRRIELAAWLCALGLGVLTVHWFNYNANFQKTVDELVTLDDMIRNTPGWVKVARAGDDSVGLAVGRPTAMR